MNNIDTTSILDATCANTAEFWILSVGDWIQLGILAGLIVYVLFTARMSNDNRIIRENTVRPVVGIFLNEDSEKHHIGIEIVNFSNTDAMGLISFELRINGKVHFLDNASYEGKSIWCFPAKQGTHGHKEFSGMLKGLDVISDIDVEFMLIGFLYYKIWSRDKEEIRKGREYYAPVKRWKFNHTKNKWVGELTSKEHLIPPVPDWSILSK